MYEESPHLDVEEALARLGGDQELLQELYAAFADDAPKKIRDLKTALEDHDFSQVTKRAHAIKGSAAAIGATRTKVLAGLLESAASDEDTKIIKKVMPLLLAEMKTLLDQLNV
jgi:HPt (histidine-containing phosphotransfer) domain-containing protein